MEDTVIFDIINLICDNNFPASNDIWVLAGFPGCLTFVNLKVLCSYPIHCKDHIAQTTQNPKPKYCCGPCKILIGPFFSAATCHIQFGECDRYNGISNVYSFRIELKNVGMRGQKITRNDLLCCIGAVTARLRVQGQKVETNK